MNPGDLRHRTGGKDRSSKADVVASDLRCRINSGKYRPGDQLPPVRELAATYEVAKDTIHRALRTLEAEGLLTVRQGSGIFVRHWRVIYRDLVAGLHLEYERALAGDYESGLFESMTGADAEVSITYEHRGADERVAERLRVEPGTWLLVRTFNYMVDGRPHQKAHSYLDADLAERLGLRGPEQERPGMGTIAYLLRAGFDLDDAWIDVDSRMPTARESAELDIDAGTPVMGVLRVVVAGARRLEVATSVVPADRVAYRVHVPLKPGLR